MALISPCIVELRRQGAAQRGAAPPSRQRRIRLRRSVGPGRRHCRDSLRLTIEANAIRQLVTPEAFNAVRRQRRVTRRVLEIAVPEVMPRLGPCLAAFRAVAKSNDPRHRSSGYAWRWYGRHGLPNPPPPSETTKARDFVRAFSCVRAARLVSPHTIRGCLDPRSRRFAIPGQSVFPRGDKAAGRWSAPSGGRQGTRRKNYRRIF
jgi:hypothetical protein